MAKKKLNRVPAFLRNKYILSLLAMTVWVVFFDRDNFFSQMELTRALNQKRAEAKFYRDEIEKDRQKITELKTNSASLEKFAREKYLMKKDNEDVFVIVEKSESPPAEQNGPLPTN